jgi:hypothetical protein
MMMALPESLRKTVSRLSEARMDRKKRICIVGASGKLGRYLVQLALERGYDVVGVCRPKSVKKLAGFEGRIALIPGRTNDPHVIARAVAGCDGVLTVLAPWGVDDYATGTAQAVLDYAAPGARLIFSCGWHISRDNRDVYPRTFQALVKMVGRLAKVFRICDLEDQVEACRRIFASESRWTVVRGSNLEEGESLGLPVWSRHVGDPILGSNIMRRIDFALFMVEALDNQALIHEAPAIAASRRGGSLL